MYLSMQQQSVSFSCCPLITNYDRNKTERICNNYYFLLLLLPIIIIETLFFILLLYFSVVCMMYVLVIRSSHQSLTRREKAYKQLTMAEETSFFSSFLLRRVLVLLTQSLLVWGEKEIDHCRFVVSVVGKGLPSKLIPPRSVAAVLVCVCSTRVVVLHHGNK